MIGMEVHLYDLDDEYICSSDIEEPPPDSLAWSDGIFRKSMEYDNGYIYVSYVLTASE